VIVAERMPPPGTPFSPGIALDGGHRGLHLCAHIAVLRSQSGYESFGDQDYQANVPAAMGELNDSYETWVGIDRPQKGQADAEE
jgi:hypothetical protein